MFDVFKRITDFAPSRRKLQCHSCHQLSIHQMEAMCSGSSEEDIGPDYSIDWGSDYLIFRCGNCDAVSFVVSSWSSEDVEPDEFGRGYNPRHELQYPPPTSSEFNFGVEFVPPTLKDLLDEMLYAVAGGKLRLSTIALRMTLEFIVKDNDCKGRDLRRKIDDLLVRDLVDDEQRSLLHKIREKGNTSVHEAKPMRKSELIAAMGIIELLLETFYNAPGRKKRFVALAQGAFSEPAINDTLI